MNPEYGLSPSYAEIARQMGQKAGDGSEIKGYSAEKRRTILTIQVIFTIFFSVKAILSSIYGDFLPKNYLL
jgi:hypothetical protein